MAAIGRASIVVVILAALSMFSLHKDHNDSTPEGVPSKARILDLSYAINDKLVPWPGDEKFFEAKVNATIEKNGYFTRSFWMLEHYGTHLDAPAHFPPGKTTVDQIPVKQLIGPAVVLDVRAEGARDADYLLPAARVEAWEKQHGRIPTGAIVLLRTGWAGSTRRRSRSRCSTLRRGRARRCCTRCRSRRGRRWARSRTRPEACSSTTPGCACSAEAAPEWK